MLLVIVLHEKTALTISPNLNKVRKWISQLGGSFPLQNMGDALPIASPILKTPTTITGKNGLLLAIKVQSYASITPGNTVNVYTITTKTFNPIDQTIL